MTLGGSGWVGLKFGHSVSNLMSYPTITAVNSDILWNKIFSKGLHVCNLMMFAKGELIQITTH